MTFRLNLIYITIFHPILILSKILIFDLKFRWLNLTFIFFKKQSPITTKTSLWILKFILASSFNIAVKLLFHYHLPNLSATHAWTPMPEFTLIHTYINTSHNSSSIFLNKKFKFFLQIFFSERAKRLMAILFKLGLRKC